LAGRSRARRKSAPRRQSGAESTMASLARGYLLLYNGSMSLGWALVLLRLVTSLASSPRDYARAYVALQPALRVFQTGALLEPLHAAISLVRAPVATTALQVASRLLLLWGVIDPLPALRAHPALVSMVGAWALTEIPRYAFFASAAAAGAPAPHWLGLVRYSTFIPLYPIGAGSEMVLLFLALPELRRTGLYSVSMPNVANFAFDFTTFCTVNLVLYVPGLPHMYMHMMRQRRKYVASAAGGGKAKAN
jgi:very-long-chain (3R)-3-hydroxyacyl-CoA dehydratase